MTARVTDRQILSFGLIVRGAIQVPRLQLQLQPSATYGLQSQEIYCRADHVSGAWAAKKPLRAPTYFCNPRSPLRDLPLRAPLRSIVFLQLPLRSTRFSACSALFSAPLMLRLHALLPWWNCRLVNQCKKFVLKNVKFDHIISIKFRNFSIYGMTMAESSTRWIWLKFFGNIVHACMDNLNLIFE